MEPLPPSKGNPTLYRPAARTVPDARLGLRGGGLSAGYVVGEENTNEWISPETIQAHTTIAIFFGNAAFLQTIWVPYLGSNGALWSLSNEFWLGLTQ